VIASIDDYRGQARLLVQLGRYLAQGKLSGSLLLVGQRGVGKTALASIIARAICCERNQDLSFCGDCYACRSIASGNQPEYRVIRPAGTQIRVDQFQGENSDVLASMSLHPVHLPRRILVVDDSHTLNEETANRMLKLLEEGPRRSLFIFVTDRPPLTRRGNLDEGLLPTITSRCLSFNLLPMNRWELEEDLAQLAPGLPRAAVIQATVMSGGSIVQSRQLAQQDGWRSAVVGLTDAICRRRDIPERAGELAEFEFDTLWQKEQADTGLSSDALAKQCSETWKPSDSQPLRVMTTARRNELQRQALASGYDRAVWWLLHEAARGLEWPARVQDCEDPSPRRGWEGQERRKASPPLPPAGLLARLALLKRRIFGNVDTTLAQAAFEATI
jgi:hypothetical protein